MSSGSVRECVWQRSCQEDECSVSGLSGDGKGVVPHWLQGSLYRVGPGVNTFGKDVFVHAFDASAIVHAFHINEGRVQYKSRVLDSKSFRSNKAANRIAVSEFGTIATPDPCQSILGRLMARFIPGAPDLNEVTDNCCVTVFFLGDEVYTATETTTIHRIHPVTLATLDGDGTKYHDHLLVNHASAHPHSESDGTTFNLANSQEGSNTFFNVLKMPVPKRDGEGKLISSLEQTEIVASIPARSKLHLSYYHSFGITENYIIFLETPLTINVLRVLLAKPLGKSIEECFDYDPKGQGRFTLVEKSTGAIHPIVYTTDAFACFHHINAFEQDDQVVVDLCSADGNVYRSLYLEPMGNGTCNNPDARPVRFVLPLKVPKEATSEENLVKMANSECTALKVSEGIVHVKDELLSNRNSEMPRINYDFNGRKYKYFYTVGIERSTVNFLSLHKTNAETKEEVGSFEEEGVQVSEPIFVPRPGATEEDDGCVLSLIFKDNMPNYAGLLILDAKTFKEIARVDFDAKGPVTHTFHGMFAPQGLLKND